MEGVRSPRRQRLRHAGKGWTATEFAKLASVIPLGPPRPSTARSCPSPTQTRWVRAGRTPRPPALRLTRPHAASCARAGTAASPAASEHCKARRSTRRRQREQRKRGEARASAAEVRGSRPVHAQRTVVFEQPTANGVRAAHLRHDGFARGVHRRADPLAVCLARSRLGTTAHAAPLPG